MEVSSESHGPAPLFVAEKSLCAPTEQEVEWALEPVLTVLEKR